MEQRRWRPSAKVAAGAVAAILAWAAQEFGGVDVPAGIEGAVAVIVAYVMPEHTGGGDE